jgi:hypothetical protein
MNRLQPLREKSLLLNLSNHNNRLTGDVCGGELRANRL